MASKERVQRHRERLRRQHCNRLEVWLSDGLIEATQRIARYQQQPLWAVVQDALNNHVGLYDMIAQTHTGTNRLGQVMERHR